jgi:hypothetical protein
VAATSGKNSKSRQAIVILLFVFSVLASRLGDAEQAAPSASLTVTPSAVNLVVGDSADLRVVDNFGRPVSDVQWTVSPSIAEIELLGDTMMLRAMQSGQAVLTAYAENLSAAATVTIAAGPQLPPTAVRWSLAPTPGYEPLILRQAVPSGDVTALYDIEWSPSAPAIVRGLQSDGEQMWMTRLTAFGNPQYLDKNLGQSFGQTSLADKPMDNLGGLLLMEDGGFVAEANPKGAEQQPLPGDGETFIVRAIGDCCGNLLLLERAHSNDTIVSISRKDGSEAWRYVSPGRLGNSMTANFNNQIATVETEQDTPNATLIVLDSDSGKTLQRIALPSSSTTIKNFKCIPGNDLVNVRPARAGSVFTSTDANIYVQVEVHNEMFDALPCNTGHYTFDNSLSLLKVTPTGETAWKSFVDIHSEADGHYVAQPRVFAGESIPDGLDGELAAWTYFFPGSKDGQKPHPEARLTRVASDFSQQFDYTLPAPGWGRNPLAPFDENMVLGEQNTLYASDEQSLISFDITKGQVNWVRRPPTGEVKIQWATAGGGILVANAGVLSLFSHAGDRMPLPWTPRPQGSFVDARDIDLAQFDLSDGTPQPPLQLRSVQLSWFGELLGVEDGPPFGHGNIMQFMSR